MDLFILKVCYSPTIWDWLNKLLFHVLQGSHHHFFFLLGLSSDCFDILFEALHFLLSKNMWYLKGLKISFLLMIMCINYKMNL